MNQELECNLHLQEYNLHEPGYNLHEQFLGNIIKTKEGVIVGQRNFAWVPK